MPGIDFSRNLALLLWMSTILSAIFATVRRELPLGSSLNYWDEAAAFIALCYLVTSINQAAAA